MDVLDQIDELCHIGADERAGPEEKAAISVIVGFLARREIEWRREARPLWLRRDQKPAAAPVAPPTHGIPKASPEEREAFQRTTTTLADEILQSLPAWVEKWHRGPTCAQIANEIDAPQYHVRAAMRDLSDAKRAVLMKRPDSSSWHLVPLGYEPPLPGMTRAQEDALRAIAARKDESGLSQISKRDISAAASISPGVVTNVVDALIKKGMIEEAKRGFGIEASIYRVLPAAAEALK